MAVEIQTLRETRSVWRAIGNGVLCRCPNCGKGRLYRRYLKIVDTCASCGEDLSHARADDFVERSHNVGASINDRYLRQSATGGRRCTHLSIGLYQVTHRLGLEHACKRIRSCSNGRHRRQLSFGSLTYVAILGTRHTMRTEFAIRLSPW